jgi:hypothetical protein
MQAGQADAPEAGAIGRLAIAVAGQAITGYLQFQALAQVLIARGIITQDDWEASYRLLLAHELDHTIDEWFPADIAAQVKAAVHAQPDGETQSPGAGPEAA